MAPDRRPECKASSRYPAHLNPNIATLKPGWREAGLIVSLIVVVTVLITLGVVKSLNYKPNSTPGRGEESVKLVGVSQQFAVFVVDANEYREVKLIDTQNLIVQDATRGQGTALASAVSPDGEMLVIILDSPNGPIVSVVKVHGGNPLRLPASTLLEAGEQAGFSQFTVCRWSSISWSSDSSCFLFFGCHKEKSAIVVVDTSNSFKVMALTNTCAVQESPRQALWLNDHEILFTYMNDAKERSSLSKISTNDVDASPIFIYGE